MFAPYGKRIAGTATEPAADIWLTRQLRHFAPLSPEDHAAIRSAVAGPVRSVQARRDLAREGDRPRCASLIVSGWGCRYKTLVDGRRQIVGFLLPGDLVDLNPGLPTRLDHSVGALTALRYAEVSNEAVARLMAERPVVAGALWRQMLASVSILREWAVNLGQRRAPERLGHLFCELHLRLQAIGLASAGGYDFPLTQSDLADATGLSPVHVNRILQQLRGAGLIRLSGQTLEFPDPAALRIESLFASDYLQLLYNDEGERLDGREAGSDL